MRSEVILQAWRSREYFENIFDKKVSSSCAIAEEILKLCKYNLERFDILSNLHPEEVFKFYSETC